MNLPKLEETILKFWQKNKIFEKSISSRKGADNFVFYEGPPTANAKAGIHHVLARVFKDIICRYKTMRGFKVLRKAGWDTHGLPVELEVEKKLGLKSKKDIEKYGIAKFNKACKESVWQYKKDWERLTDRIGFWLDMKNPYVTYNPEYIETVWWILKEIYQKGLIYQAHKVVPYCPRCGTSLSSHEVAQGYKTVKDRSVYIKFKLKKGQFITNNFTTDDKTYILSWTTTPWTLPGNVALAVKENIEYTFVNYKNEKFILAKNLVEKVFGREIEIIGRVKGRRLVDLKYEPLFNIPSLKNERSYKLYSAPFVTDKEGTGIVHTAVMYGEDDYELGKRHNLPKQHTVDEEGKFTGLVPQWEGIFVKEAEPLIVENLTKRNLLLKEELYEHEYPFCWRCNSPLLYYAKESWFVNMQKVKGDLIKNNQKVNWVPSYLKNGRFGQWLKEVKDWAISRERYWGTPLPFWKCQNGKIQKLKIKTQNKCNNIQVIGSTKELEKLSGKKIPKDLHRPFIDKITFQCEQCGGKMKRVKEVLDCWFDSGSMPFAQYHYPFENKDFIEKKLQFPADYISEGIDQTRGWFYTLLAISTLLGKGPAYKNIISLGHVLDEKGEKMSKSKGNVVDPWYIIQKYGIDAVRWYFYTINQPGDSKLFREKDIEESLRKFIHILWNSYLFYNTYALKIKNLRPKTKNVLDRWIISRLNELILNSTRFFDKYNVTTAARLIENFVINDLSLWYIRRSRRRFQRPKSAKELKEASENLGYIILTLSKLTAPFIPFLSEEIYQGSKTSVHLEDWPRPNKNLINNKLMKQMEEVRRIVNLALSKRAKVKIKVRQPLNNLQLTTHRLKTEKELLELIKDEVNVKNITFGKSFKLDTKITPELKEEGIVREIIRQLQEMRKKAGLKPRDKIKIQYSAPEQLKKIIEKRTRYILEETEARTINFKKELKQEEFIIADQKLKITIQKI